MHEFALHVHFPLDVVSAHAGCSSEFIFEWMVHMQVMLEARDLWPAMNKSGID